MCEYYEDSTRSQKQDVVNALLARNLFADKAPKGEEAEVLQELEHLRIDKPSLFIVFAALLAALTEDSQISFLSICLVLSGLNGKTELYHLLGEVNFKNPELTGIEALARLLGNSPTFIVTLKKILDAVAPAGHDESEAEATQLRAKRIGKRLQRLRRTLRMSYDALAYPEFAPRYIEGIEAGRIGSSDKALAVICSKLNIKLEDFLKDIDSEPLD